MSKIIMTSAQLVERLKKLASRNTFYKNQYPYNLCYVHDNGQTSADCVNLYKALLNGLDVNNLSAGYYQNDLSNTGDVTEWGLMSQCTDVSQNFSKLKAGEPRLLYMQGHIGGYISEEVTINSKVYNCIECTASWSGGILYSYVDSNGRRFNHKGGTQNGAWSHNGKMTPWVNYTSVTSAPSKKTNAEIAQEVIDGKWGNQPERQQKLESAGYDYRTIQSLVNEMVKKPAKSIEELAQEVIAGKWGNNPQRKEALTKAGYDYTKIQAKVNELLR